MAPTEWRPVRALRLHPVAAQLLEVAGNARRFPAEVPARVIEILPDGTVVAGVRAFLRARQGGRERVRVVVRAEWADEDAALVAGEVVKDVLAGSADPIAVGTAWAAFRKFCAGAGRPRKGYAKTKYVRRFRISPVDRLKQIVRDTFGLSDDQLRRMEVILPLPAELHDALRAETVTLKALVALTSHPGAVAAVVTDVKAGMPPAEALARHLPPREDRPEAHTALRRLLRADDQAVADLADRVAEIGYLTDADRARVQRGRELRDALLRLATEGEVHEHIARVLGRASGGEEAA